MTDILVEHDGPVATVVFNRPKVRNAISLAMWTELARVTEGLAKDDSVRAIVYRGAGREAFASGADISEFKEHRKDTATALRYNAQTSAAYTAIRECPKPTVAMVFGFCMGGAMAVAMACDLRFAAQGSKFGIPAARLSIIYGADAVGQLVDLVGPAYAKDILYSARTVGDREALAMGLIQRLLPPDELEAHAYDYLRKVADNAPLSVRGAKLTIESYLLGLTEERRAKLKGLALEAFESEDYKEGTRAFLTSTPLSPTEGSGTFVALDGLVRGLERLGHVARVRPLRVRTNFHTLDRWLYNVGALLSPPAGDVVVGVDLDGFLLARRRRRPFVAMLKGIIADELRNERGTVRALLTVQARWERVNAGRADRVVVSSRYSASVAGEAYGRG